MWFQSRPPSYASPLIYQLPYKFWLTWEPAKYQYTYTDQPEDISNEMMQSSIYKNSWRPNGYVVPYYPNLKKEKMVEFYDSSGKFVYYISVHLTQDEIDEMNKKEKVLIVTDSIIEEKLESGESILPLVESSIEEKIKEETVKVTKYKKRSRKKKSDK